MCSWNTKIKWKILGNFHDTLVIRVVHEIGSFLPKVPKMTKLAKKKAVRCLKVGPNTLYLSRVVLVATAAFKPLQFTIHWI